MKLFALGAAIATLTYSVVAFAHGGGKHYMGTVKTVEAGAITVASMDKKEVKINVDAVTKYEKAGKAALAADLVVGERVVVHTAKSAKSGPPKAILVKFGAAPKEPAGKRDDHPGKHDDHGAASGEKKH